MDVSRVTRVIMRPSYDHIIRGRGIYDEIFYLDNAIQLIMNYDDKLYHYANLLMIIKDY